MPRKKKPEGETSEQTEQRRIMETISNTATRSEKVSWDRKMDNMVTQLALLRPIEEKIVEAMAEKQPIFDQIAQLRANMVTSCIHPLTHLVYKSTEQGTYIACKFCERKFST
jgi:hypothetical protein